MSSVKPQSARQVKAAATRRRMLQAAYEMFCEQGFRGVKMAEIAERAGVAVQTLYFTFHTKDELLQAVQDWNVLGDDPTPPPLQPWYLAAVAEPDLRIALEHFARGNTSLCARVAPTVPVFYSVLGEPSGDMWLDRERLRRDGFEDLMDVFIEKAPLRAGMTKRQANDILFFLGGPESYRSLVLVSGWTPGQWTTWLADSIARDVFGLV